MNVRRGDVVLLNYPYTSGTGAKVRPALVVQDDSRNQRLTNTVVVMITGNTSRVAVDTTQLLIDVSARDGQQSGLRVNSAVTCGNIFTVNEQLIRKKIGSLDAALMQRIDVCLKAALSLS